VYEKLLDRFFNENAVKNNEIPSAPAFAHFEIKLLLNPDTNEQIQVCMSDLVFKGHPNREGEVLAERSDIESATTSTQIIRYMRRHVDPMNHHILVNRAMQFEDELIPEVIKMMKTSLNTSFIEAATRVLSVSGMDIADELIGCFDDVRGSYARSMILVVLGYKANEAHIPWLIEKHKELKRQYPDESHCDGAYYALLEIEARLFPV